MIDLQIVPNLIVASWRLGVSTRARRGLACVPLRVTNE
jgi:hypothetical protein